MANRSRSATQALGLCAVLFLSTVQAEELPQSQACRTALDAFNREEAVIAASAASAADGSDQNRQRLVSERLYPFRKRVADACLGGFTTSPPPSQHTLAVPISPLRANASPAPLRLPASPPVTVHIPRPEPPVTVSSCNAATCIGSDGSMLTRVGPNLVGPRGLCTRQGIFVVCP